MQDVPKTRRVRVLVYLDLRSLEMVASFSPPYTDPGALAQQLKEGGFAALTPEAVAALAGVELQALHALDGSWDALLLDPYLKDGGRYRQRRHSCFVVAPEGVSQVPHRAHWQSLDYNALHGGMHRWFEPIQPQVVGQPAFQQLMGAIAAQCSAQRPDVPEWFVEAHQFRIDTTDGIGRPTPEGAHRDGVDYVAVLLLGRHGIKGGETRVFEANGPRGLRFTLTEPWSLMLLDDARMIHESTPIQPLDDVGYRDTLVLTYRAGGFQGEA